MKTQRAIDLAGNAKALADLLEITPSAISQWGDDVPQPRYWQLRVLRPGWFEERSEDSHPGERKSDKPEAHASKNDHSHGAY